MLHEPHDLRNDDRRVHSAILLMPWGPQSHLSFVVIYIAVISNNISSYFILIHLFFGKFIDMITVGGAFRWAFAFFRPPHLRIALTGNFTTESVRVSDADASLFKAYTYTLHIAHQSTSFSLHTLHWRMRVESRVAVVAQSWIPRRFWNFNMLTMCVEWMELN